MRGNFSPEMLMSVKWAAHYLPEEEGDLDPVELAALREELASLRMAVEACELPSAIRDFVLRQIESMQAVLQRYPITGVTNVKRVVREVVGDVFEHGETIVGETSEISPEAHTILNRFGVVWKKVVALSGDFDKIAKAFGYVTAAGQKALPYLKALFES